MIKKKGGKIVKSGYEDDLIKKKKVMKMISKWLILFLVSSWHYLLGP